MTDNESFQVYLNLANDLFDGQIPEDELSPAVTQLPHLDKQLLDRLAAQAENFALTTPRRSWAIAQVADAAADSQNRDVFLQSLAAWYLGRACNHWTQPQRVNKAISRARQGFKELNEDGWVAACDWQINILSWTKTDFIQSEHELQQALVGLHATGLTEFVPHCGLALSYVQILVGKYEQARENISTSEAYFLDRGDLLNQARCWLNEASLYRRQVLFDQASDRLTKALNVFEGQNARLDVAKAKYQLALLHLLRTDDLSIAISNFNQAIEIFSKCDLDLWEAACKTNLGSIYLQAGQLAQTEACYQEARQSFTQHNVLGLLADNLNDGGKLNLLKGLPEISIEQYKQAEEIYKKLGATLAIALEATNLGEAYGQMGRYQDALHHLERAADQLKLIGHSLHLGTCEMYMAQVWSQLGQPALAHEHLNKAATCYEDSKQKALFSFIYNSRARIYFDQGQTTNGIDWLKKSLKTAEEHGVRPQTALAHRLLGEAFIAIGKLEDGQKELENALSAFSEMGMSIEQAATWVALGTYYSRNSQPIEARRAFEQTLQLSEGTSPEVDWRAYAGLAELSETGADPRSALDAYRLAIATLSKIRHNFWQPALAGSYLQAPSLVFDKAIHLAGEIDAPEEGIQFIEAAKASTILRQLSTSNTSAASDQDLQPIQELKAEIGWLQTQLRVSFDAPNRIKSAVQTHELRAQLIEKMKQYDAVLASLERKRSSADESAHPSDHFDLGFFRKLADRSLGKSWVALDYYRVEDQLITAVITADQCQLISASISERAEMALRAILQTSRNGTPPIPGDLRILGDLLIPESVMKSLTPQTHLILAPHKNLHGLPWPALQPALLSQPLVCACIPSVVPSLHSLTLLWQRKSARTGSQHRDGLLIGISEFQGKNRELPYVKDEIRALSAKVGLHGQVLAEQNATLGNLMRVKNDEAEKDLSRFGWMHVASHFSPDPHTGRLSGIVLSDGDVWLDQVRDLASLPALVSFSACNSIYSFLYEGDEHVGLPVTCLISGADSVIGSTWPILDQSAADFTISFYNHYFEGLSPAQAAAQTQRKMIEHKETIEHWASFTCMGVP